MSFYKQVQGCNLSKAQMLAASKGKPIQLSKSQLSGGSMSFHTHPANYEKILKARRGGKGTRLQISPYAIQHDLEKLQGASIWSWIKNAAKDVYKFGKDNWDIIKPVVSKAADAAIPAIATMFGQPTLAIPARGALKSLTGIGVRGKVVKGSQEAKDKMARLRAMRKTKSGGSFRLS